MADNTVRDGGPIIPTEEAKRLGANLATPKKAKIARERKLQTNPAGKNRNKTNFKRKQVKKATVEEIHQASEVNKSIQMFLKHSQS